MLWPVKSGIISWLFSAFAQSQLTCGDVKVTVVGQIICVDATSIFTETFGSHLLFPVRDLDVFPKLFLWVRIQSNLFHTLSCMSSFTVFFVVIRVSFSGKNQIVFFVLNSYLNV